VSSLTGGLDSTVSSVASTLGCLPLLGCLGR
jgi:hypothetical protein